MPDTPQGAGFDRLPASAWEHLGAIGRDGLVVLWAIAHHFQRESALPACTAYPSVRTLCALTRLTRRSVQAALAKLEKASLLRRDLGRGPGGASVYMLGSAAFQPAQPVAPPAQPVAPPHATGNAPLAQLTAPGTRTIEPEKKKSSRAALPTLPAELAMHAAFPAAWERWQRHLREKRRPLTTATAEENIRDFLKWGADAAVERIAYSIGRGYPSLFPPDGGNGRASVPTAAGATSSQKAAAAEKLRRASA